MTPQIAPTIPDSAPFSPEQREWLNGMLAELFSRAPHAASAAPAPAESLKIAIYVASQSGTAERLAKKIAKQLKTAGHVPSVVSLEKVTPAMIAEQEMAFFVASTYGEGEPPESARIFRDALLDDAAPMLRGLRYAVFCLGDRNYEHFCRFGIELDERLKALGAHRILPRVESDVDVDAPFAAWAEELTPHLRRSDNVLVMPAKEAEASYAAARLEAPTHTRDNPYHAELRERRTLTAESSSKQTVHLSFALEDSAIHYEAGDACGVIAQNCPTLVEEILSLLGFPQHTQLEIPKHGPVSMEDALAHHLQITRMTRKMVQAFAERAQCSKLAALLIPEQSARLEEFLHGRGLIDLLLEYPGAIGSADELAAVLPRLTPRLYSISSSPAAHGREVHCTVGVVRYRTQNRNRGGVASTMLADRTAVGSRLPIYIQPNKKFRIPADSNQPMVMIGPGTGIAPFRAFLHERRALGHSGRNWLFFGERSATTDFLYREELSAMHSDGHLTRFDTAFSRDQQQKIYVQDRMLEHGAELWQWLEDGAQVYVCGDASRMAKDVDAALHTVMERHGGMDAEAAREYVSQLQEDHRYHRDVY